MQIYHFRPHQNMSFRDHKTKQNISGEGHCPQEGCGRGKRKNPSPHLIPFCLWRSRFAVHTEKQYFAACGIRTNNLRNTPHQNFREGHCPRDWCWRGKCKTPSPHLIPFGASFPQSWTRVEATNNALTIKYENHSKTFTKQLICTPLIVWRNKYLNKYSTT